MLERTASPPWDSVITYRDGKQSIAATAEGSISAVRLQAPASRGGSRLAGAALAADPLVELDAVALLGGLAALPAAKASDLAEEVVSVSLLCGLPTLPARLGPAHFPGFLHPTTSWSDVYHEDSRKPEVTFGRSIEEDLARRDFTVNAMAVRLPDGRFIDPFGGLTDLANRRLRTPSSPATSFEDDPLRMLRAARFVAQLELVPTQETVEAITERVGRLEIVSRERIRDELEKLLRGRAPGKGLWLVVQTGLANQFLPELPALALEQDPVHRHKDVLAHTIAVVERATAFDADRLGWTDSAVRRYVRDAGDLLDRLNFLVRSDCTTRNPFKAKQLAAACDELEGRIARLEAEEELAKIKPPLNGDEVMALLGVPPGPIVGKALSHLLELRLDRGPMSTQDATEALLAWAREQGLEPPGPGEQR